MFDLLAEDLVKAPLTYAVVNDVDVRATKVKLSLAIPWLEIVCGKTGEEEIFLIADTSECQRFALSEKCLEIASISCRALERRTGRLTSLEFSKVVGLEDGMSIRYGLADGSLFDPLTLKRDACTENESVDLLFEVNQELKHGPLAKRQSGEGSARC